MSGVVPLVAAMVGPGAAGTAYIPGLADFVPMVKDIGSMALAGPPLVKAVTGQDISEQELGGTKVHTEKSGVGDVEVADDSECIGVIKEYLSFLPSHCEEKPPIIVCKRSDRSARRAAARRPARVDAAVVRHVRDHQAASSTTDASSISSRSSGAPSSPGWRASAGGPCGIVANNPRQMGGILTNDSRRQGGALHSALRRVQCAARVPDGRAGIHGRLQGRARGHHPPRRQDAARDGVGDGAQAHRGGAQGIWRRLFRHGRARLRAGSDRRVAGRGDQRHGRRGHGRHRRAQAVPGGRAAARGRSSSWRRRFSSTSTSTRSRAGDWSTTSSIRATRARCWRSASSCRGTRRVERPWRKHGVMPV